MSRRNPAAQGGFTLVEVVMVAALLGLILGAIAMSLKTTSQSLTADDQVGRAMESLQRCAVRIAHLARSCAITTYRVNSVAADVPLRATAPNQWIEPQDGEPRTAIQFRSADGRLSMNAQALTQPREFRIRLDPGEVLNGLDDDGDGLIDQGTLVMTYEGVEVELGHKVESATFTLTDRLLAIDLVSGVRRRDGSVQRFKIHETTYLRNN
jgi:prepilin-type N-terminal cleavage/methylation domain-containing protein